jgi:uncharacterized protein YndB with AHSA1/START domain
MDITGATRIDPLDRIDRSVEIDASPERVWSLVSRPGWWINEGTIDTEPEGVVDGDQTVVTHPTYGEFRLQTVESRPPSYVAFRWLDRDVDAGTLVELWIEPRDAGVTLRVAESGFSRLGKPREEWLRQREGNVEGWRVELEEARRFTETSGAGA